MSKYTEDELAQLTDEEREAIESDDDIIDTTDENADDNADEGQPTDTTDTDDEGDEQDGGDESGEDDGDDESDTEGDGGSEDDGQQQPDDDAQDVEQEQSTEARQDYVPSFRSDVPEDLDERLTKIADEKADLRKKYNEGDIDFDEYESRRDELDEQRRELEQVQFKAALSQEIRQDRWLNHDVAGFLSKHPEYEQGSPLYVMLDAEVRKLQGQADEEGKDPLDPAILTKAHENIRNSLTKVLGAEASAGKKAEAKKGKPPAKRETVPSLANLPAAEVEDTDGGRWAHLDRLLETNPARFEDELAKMSEAEQNAYLAAR